MRRSFARYDPGTEGGYLRRPRDRPRGFREVSTLTDKEAVKKLFHSPLMLQRKQREATDRCTRAALSVALYACHFLDGSARALDEIGTRLADLSRTAAPKSCTLQDGLRELDSLARESRAFLAHGQLATSDMTSTVVASDVNMTLALRDKFLTKLLSYLSPKHRGMLRKSGFCSDQLFPSLPEVGAAAREDATHESTHQLAAMCLPQGSWPSARGPPPPRRSGGSQTDSGRMGQPGSRSSGLAQSSGAAHWRDRK